VKNGIDRIIVDERAADQKYLNALRLAERERVPVHHGRGGAGRRPSAAPPSRGLLGRVALDEPTDFFEGTSFYIGSRPHDGDDMVVFSWAARIAGTFFGQLGTHDLCPRVTARRTLLRRGGQVVDYVDDDGPAPRSGDPFAARKLSIPKAPTRRPLPGRTASASSGPEQRRPEVADGKDRTARRDEFVPPTVAPPPGLRAGQAVLAALKAPRQQRLTSVLATLQPGQYELVTADPEKPLVIEGHPGTGKTIIAAHRAAYLVHADNERRSRRVLLLGPTEHYVQHVKGVLNELVDGPGTVDVMSLDEVMLDVRGLSVELDGGRPVHFRDVEDELGQFAEYAVNLLRAEGRIGPRTAHAGGVEATYEALRLNRVGARPISRDVEWIDYFRALPSFRAARAMGRYLPLLAACGAAVANGAPYRYDHVIVDEAQDVTALEWAVLKEMSASGSWALLGDMNQRRSDLSCRGWSQITDIIDEQVFGIETLRQGYRTSTAIMQFAGRLLPSSERTVTSLQTGGAPPRVERARAGELYSRVADEVAGLFARIPEGTIAVIGMDPWEAMRALRRAGFNVDPRDPDTMLHGGRTVRVLDPQRARGLEFDAAVVVEPGAFPPRLERHGLLYTSLTRANRELVVVHCARLPDALRTRSTPRRRSAPTSLVPPQRTSDQSSALWRSPFATG
jgi:DNA helicase-2/ATP-dependent DNA helicase PcrA